MRARSSWPMVAGLAVVLACAVAVPASAGTSWWLSKLDVSGAWQYSRGEGVTVAVLSTGVDRGAIGAVTTGPDFTGSGRAPGNQFWGTAGTADAGLIASVAPEVRFLSLRVTLEYNDPLNSDAAITRRLPSAIASGINYAVSHGARIIDLPLDPGANGLNDAGQTTGDPAAAGGSTAEAAAVRNAISHGVVVVAPAGDNGIGRDSVNYPADYPGVISVGAITRSGTVASYSNRRSDVGLLAPGSALAVRSPSGTVTLSTTDNAAALVTGIAALIRSRYPGLSVTQVTSALTRGASSGSSGAAASGGASRVANAAAALRSAALLATVHPSPAASKPPARPAPKHPAIVAVASGALANSVVRDAVLVLAAVIVLLGAVLLTVRTRLRRRRPEGADPITWRAAVSGLRKAPQGTHARRAHPSSPAAPAPRLPRTHRGQGTLGGYSSRPMLAPVPGSLRRPGPRGESRPPWDPAPPPAGEQSDHGTRSATPLPPSPPSPRALPPSAPPSALPPSALPPSALPPSALPPSARPFSPRPLPSAASPLQLPAGSRPGEPLPMREPFAMEPEPFAAAPIPTDLPDWSHWNPTADTDRFPVIPPGPDTPDTDPPREGRW